MNLVIPINHSECTLWVEFSKNENTKCSRESHGCQKHLRELDAKSISPLKWGAQIQKGMHDFESQYKMPKASICRRTASKLLSNGHLKKIHRDIKKLFTKGTPLMELQSSWNVP